MWFPQMQMRAKSAKNEIFPSFVAPVEPVKMITDINKLQIFNKLTNHIKLVMLQIKIENKPIKYLLLHCSLQAKQDY